MSISRLLKYIFLGMEKIKNFKALKALWAHKKECIYVKSQCSEIKKKFNRQIFTKKNFFSIIARKYLKKKILSKKNLIFTNKNYFEFAWTNI